MALSEGRDHESVSVLVRHRASEFADQKAIMVGSVIYADQLCNLHNMRRRYFWLLEYQVQLVYEPFGWQHEWYVDLVEMERSSTISSTVFTVRDMEVDIVVEGMGPTYRIIDLDVFGTRASAGEFSLTECRDVLLRTQRFLDAFLHREVYWPPPAIIPFFSLDHTYPN